MWRLWTSKQLLIKDRKVGANSVWTASFRSDRHGEIGSWQVPGGSGLSLSFKQVGWLLAVCNFRCSSWATATSTPCCPEVGDFPVTHPARVYFPPELLGFSVAPSIILNAGDVWSRPTGNRSFQHNLPGSVKWEVELVCCLKCQCFPRFCCAFSPVRACSCSAVSWHLMLLH